MAAQGAGEPTLRRFRPAEKTVNSPFRAGDHGQGPHASSWGIAELEYLNIDVLDGCDIFQHNDQVESSFKFDLMSTTGGIAEEIKSHFALPWSNLSEAKKQNLSAHYFRLRKLAEPRHVHRIDDLAPSSASRGQPESQLLDEPWSGTSSPAPGHSVASLPRDAYHTPKRGLESSGQTLHSSATKQRTTTHVSTQRSPATVAGLSGQNNDLLQTPTPHAPTYKALGSPVEHDERQGSFRSFTSPTEQSAPQRHDPLCLTSDGTYVPEETPVKKVDVTEDKPESEVLRCASVCLEELADRLVERFESTYPDLAASAQDSDDLFVTIDGFRCTSRPDVDLRVQRRRDEHRKAPECGAQ